MESANCFSRDGHQKTKPYNTKFVKSYIIIVNCSGGKMRKCKVFRIEKKKFIEKGKFKENKIRVLAIDFIVSLNFLVLLMTCKV